MSETVHDVDQIPMGELVEPPEVPPEILSAGPIQELLSASSASASAPEIVSASIIKSEEVPPPETEPVIKCEFDISAIKIPLPPPPKFFYTDDDE